MAIGEQLEAGLTREQLQRLLPAGAARNAIDCALWDLQARREGKTWPSCWAWCCLTG